jgi:DNA polymerase III subunit delta'
MTAWSPHAWQKERWGQVQGAIAGGRLAHALLLAGPRGAGKDHFAHGLASYLLCEADVKRRPCGECRSCVQIAAGMHPNLMRLQPAEDKRDIAIDDIRDLLDRLHLSSHYGQAKVAIVSPADALNPSGVNALLKTIEEPPAATHIILVAERWRALPATLRSRCQILRFARPPQAAADPGEWGRALAEACEGRMQALRVAHPAGRTLKRDEAQLGLETWLQTATAWLRALALPGGATAAPRGLGPVVAGQLLDDTLEALRALERNGNPTLLVESIMIRLSQRALAGRG